MKNNLFALTICTMQRSERRNNGITPVHQNCWWFIYSSANETQRRSARERGRRRETERERHKERGETSEREKYWEKVLSNLIVTQYYTCSVSVHRSFVGIVLISCSDIIRCLNWYPIRRCVAHHFAENRKTKHWTAYIKPSHHHSHICRCQVKRYEIWWQRDNDDDNVSSSLLALAVRHGDGETLYRIKS